jgi:hypothetical protein
MATPKGSNGSAQDELNGILQAESKGRVAVHKFDPDAPPAEKAAVAGKARDQVKSKTDGATHEGERGMWYLFRCTRRPPSTLLHAEIAVDAPQITVENADEKKQTVNGEAFEGGMPATPGGMPAGLAHVIPDWYRVGWRGMLPPPAEGEQRDKSILDLFLHEQFYGEWYHNAAIIVVVRGCGSSLPPY